MKKTKFITPILLSTTTLAVALPLSSCACNPLASHISIDDAQKIKTMDTDGSVSYVFALDKDSYTTDTLKVELTGDHSSDLSKEVKIEGKTLTLTIKCPTPYQDEAVYNFDVVFKYTTVWTQTIQGFKLSLVGGEQAKKVAAINAIIKDQDIPTMSALLAILLANNIDLETLTTTAETDQWVWDSEQNVVFVMSANGEVVTAPSGYVLNQHKTNIWKMVSGTTTERLNSASNIGVTKDSFSPTSQYSQYLRSDATFASKDLTFCSGLDTGVHTEFNLTFKKDETITDAVPAIINTSRSSLTVESSLDDITHYGNLKTLTITELPADGVYTEYGNVDARVILNSGKIVAEEGSTINDIVITSDNAKGVEVKPASTIGTVVATTDVSAEKVEKLVKVDEGAVKPEIIEVKQDPSVTPPRYAGGFGTKNSPYAIESYEQLKNCRKDVNTAAPVLSESNMLYFKVIADITIPEGETWTSIGTSSTNPFYGVFDGNYYSISNLKITSSTAHNGLFGLTKGKDNTAFNAPEKVWDYNNNQIKSDAIAEKQYSTVIKNITLKNVNYSLTANQKYMGGIAGEATNTLIDNCCVESGTITGYKCVGGIAGSMKGTTISNCSTGAELSLSAGTGYNIGGICGTPGYNYNGHLTTGEAIVNCENNANIDCTPSNEASGGYSGGIAGYISTPHSPGSTAVGCIIDNCVNNGKLTSSGSLNTCTGGIAGLSNNLFVISNCTNNGPIVSTQDIGSKDAYLAGITEGANLRIFNSKNTEKGNITAEKATDIAGIFAFEGSQGKELEMISCSNKGTLTNTNNPTAVHDLAASINDVVLSDVEYPNVAALNAAIACKSNKSVSLKMTNVRVHDTSDTPLCFGSKMTCVTSDRKICDTIKVEQNTVADTLTISLPDCNITVNDDCSHCYFVQQGANSTVTITTNGKLNNAIVTGANSKIINNGTVINGIGVDGAAVYGENNGTCSQLSLGSNAALGTVDKHFVNNGTICYTGSGYSHTVNTCGGSVGNITLDNYGTIQLNKTGGDPTYVFCIYNIGETKINCYENSKVITNSETFATSAEYTYDVYYKAGATYNNQPWSEQSFGGYVRLHSF